METQGIRAVSPAFRASEACVLLGKSGAQT